MRFGVETKLRTEVSEMPRHIAFSNNEALLHRPILALPHRIGHEAEAPCSALEVDLCTAFSFGSTLTSPPLSREARRDEKNHGYFDLKPLRFCEHIGFSYI